MVLSAVELFKRHGYNGTGFREVVTHSGAPRGSIYHHFPGGKAQLGSDAVLFAGEFSNAFIARKLGADDVVAGLESFWRSWTRAVEASDFQEGCPIVAVAAESHPEAPELTAAAAEVFDQWRTTFAGAFRKAGLTSTRDAQELATLVIAALEGATVMSRAAHDTRPLVRTGRQLARILRDTLPDAKRQTR
jgi:AcrR family transcriptional regulator